MRKFLPILGMCLIGNAPAATTYDADVKPILREACFSCHNADKKKSGLDLSTYEALMKGGSGGDAVKAGVPDSSYLYLSMIHAEDVEPMPPKKPKLDEAQIDIVRQWIEEGLVEVEGGKSKLREIEFEVGVGSGVKPDGPPAMPVDLPAIELPARSRPGPVLALAASPWAPVVAAAGHGHVALFSSENRELIGRLAFPERTPHVVKFSRSGALLLAAGGRGGHSGAAALFDVKTGSRLAGIGEEMDAVLAADVSSDHQLVALGGPAKLVKIYSAKNGKLLHKIKKHTDWITALEFSPDGKLLATGDRNGGIHVWESVNGRIVFSLSDHKNGITDLSWRPDSKMLASVAEDGKLVLWDMKDGWPSKVLVAHEDKKSKVRYSRSIGALSVEFAMDGRLVTTGRDKAIRVWSADGKALEKIEGLETIQTSGVFAAGGDLLISGDTKGSVTFWKLDKKIETLGVVRIGADG